MHLRIPEGVRSVVDADLALRGNVASPTLGGVVTVKSAIWGRRIDTPGSIFDLASRRASAAGGGSGPAGEAAVTLPLKFDLQLLVPSTLRVENNLARLVANADLTLRGTYDRPVVMGHADIAHLIVTFLALLELARERLVTIAQAEPFAPIFVRLAAGPGFVLESDMGSG